MPRPHARRLPSAALAGLICLGAASLGAAADQAPLSARKEPPPPVEKGAGLAAIGGCEGCHTAAGGTPFAGGRPFVTPFGTLYSTNLTPDRERGIGGWSQADFLRAMTRGIGPRGERYYPVFPYPHYALAERGDLAAIYRYLRTLPPAPNRPPPNRLFPPFGFRPLLILWQALFLHPVAPNARGLDASGRRGAELVAGLGHCGACHTPRDALQAEDADRPLAGAMAEGWYAPPLQSASPAPTPWTAEDLETYLRTGLSNHHQAAAGPMGAVTRELSQAPEQEVRDMAIYLSGLMSQARRPTPVDQAATADRTWPEGAQIYAGACASCHDAGSAMRRQGRPSLAVGTPLDEDRPTDVIMILLKGLTPAEGKAGPYMPPFADSLTDAQVAQLTGYLRAQFSREPPWKDIPAAVRIARRAAA